jgi:hypothetical protein
MFPQISARAPKSFGGRTGWMMRERAGCPEAFPAWVPFVTVAWRGDRTRGRIGG